MPSDSARSLDHLILPVAELAYARRRLTDLGFTVAADGEHPFGTANCCVYFADGTFLEALAVADEIAIDAAVAVDNQFVVRDRAFRDLAGAQGFSAIALASNDASADDEAFRLAGISAGPALDFSRQFIDLYGRADQASFRLAFAADAASVLPFFFTCQVVHAPAVDRTALKQHANGVSGIRNILLAAAEPAVHAGFLTAFLGVEPRDIGAAELDYSLANVDVTILSRNRIADFLGAQPDEHTFGLDPEAIVFGCGDINATRSVLDVVAAEHYMRDGMIIVPPATGQGAHFVFETSA